MNARRALLQGMVALGWVGLGCDGQQYVSPDTVAVVIRDEGTNVQRLDECHFIPVLLGSRSVSHHRIDSRLGVTVDITRDDVVVSFEAEGMLVEPFRVPSLRFEGATRESAQAPPAGYSVELVSPCVP